MSPLRGNIIVHLSIGEENLVVSIMQYLIIFLEVVSLINTTARAIIDLLFSKERGLVELGSASRSNSLVEY